MQKVSFRYIGAFAGILLLLALVGWILSTQLLADSQPGQNVVEASDQVVFEDVTGIRIVRVVLAAAGGIVDIHYQILDPDKSLVVHDDDNPPTVIKEATGEELNFEFHEHGFEALQTARTYRLHIMNSGNALQRGDVVTMRVGGVALHGLTIQ